MSRWNKYYKIAFWGAIMTFMAKIVISVAADPFLASAFTPFYAVWGITAVVGWRHEHPRR